MPSRSRAARLTGGCVALGVAGAAFTALGLPASAAPTAPFVSEIHYDNAGTDTGEFVEVQLPAGTSSAGLSIVLYNGGNGASYDTDPLPAVTAPADAPAVAVVDYPANGVQNGSPDGVALVRGTEVLEFLSYEGVFTATNGPAAGRTSTDIGVAEQGTEPAGQSLSRTVAADGALTWSGPAPATRGAVNAPAATPEPSLPGEVVEIGAVQGTGATTPLAGRQVTVTGVVVGDTPGLSGFYLQDPDGDGDPATSDGVFVSSAVAVDLGDTVTVTGRAEERFEQTQVSASSVTVTAEGTAADLPAPAVLDLPADDAARERLEGMRVAPADRLTVSEVYDLTTYGELTLSEGGVLVQPTELARPGAGAQAIAEQNALRSIVLDDAVSARVSVTTRPYLSPATPVRVGDELTFTEPLVLGYGFDAWRLQPADGSADGVFAPQDTRPRAPEAVGGDVQVGAFNVLNYFLTFDQNVGRGATSQAELEQQAGKIVPAIRALGADVVTLMEIEDTDSTGLTPGNANTALADLVRRLNTAAGFEEWAYVPMPDELYAVDRDVIRNAIVYKQDVVQPVGEPVGLVDESVWSNAREPIAQTFVKDGDAFTVVANHFKSKGGTGTGDNADTGQGSFNGDRVRQARSLAGFLADLRTSTGDADVVALGDFNAYTQEDPIEVLRTDAGLVDLGERFDEGRYSYVFDALSGSLDHALASAELTAKVTDATHWNINSVESFAYQYTGDDALYAPNPYRSSDHDPIVLGIDLDERCQGLVPTIRGTEGNDVLKGTNGRDVIMGLGGNDVITGGNGDDVVCGGAGDDTLSGGNGDDVLVGGFGDDRLAGDNGADVLIGGPGTDALEQGRGSGREQQDGAES
ncbi:ExeM/NucH family extracellular endonuclease [Kineococcus sp. SYSU DK006]|uniref:ExeM/NucH family extracellular endonuclease n=1 Tax=Kineococcus sp. SYSU DK006 TaxID=3383127 RepID=UPI003D7C74AA